jgi:hypothetical protein
MDSFDQDLMNALQDDNQPQNQQENGGQADHNGGDVGPIFHLPPPPEYTYDKEADLDRAMHAWSLEHGYELVRRAAKKNAAGQVYKRYHHCSKHGQKSGRAEPKERKRAFKKTNRIGCPMSIASVAIDPSNPEGGWQIRHRKSYHNHPADNPSALAGHRRRAREGGVEKAVDGLLSIGTSTAQILQFLQKTHPSGLFTRTDVANMKLKWRKYGTSSWKPQEDEQVKPRGRGEACVNCRAKKRGCGGQRPACVQCQTSSKECHYNNEPEDTDVQGEAETEPMDIITPAPSIQNQQPNGTSSTPNVRGLPPARGVRAMQAAQTKEILNELRSFQAEHINRERLSLQSSLVETIVASTCGTGESYNRLPILSGPIDWPHFRDAVVATAMDENTYEVLIGAKIEPQKPRNPENEGGEVDVETWNEYIKQLAIYNRRNNALLAALRSHLSPSLRNRVHGFVHASLIWQSLEDLCQPRGSETAWKLYTDLHDISLTNSADLKDYIHRMTTTYAQFKLLKLNTSPHATNWKPRGQSAANAPTAEKGEDAVPEEMVCFLFLKNLGAGWRHWVDGLVATNNIGGFGTGDRLGLNELCKRAEAYEAMQRRELGR